MITELLDQLRVFGARLHVQGGTLVIDAPKDVISENLKARLAAHERELIAHLNAASGAVIEATLRSTMPWPDLLAAVKPQNPEFSACPDCRQARYCISPRGRVVCGKCGEVRFVVVAIRYHPVS